MGAEDEEAEVGAAAEVAVAAAETVGSTTRTSVCAFSIVHRHTCS